MVSGPVWYGRILQGQRGVAAPLVDGLEIEHVTVDFGAVDLRVVPLHTVRGFLRTTFIKSFQKIFVAADFVLLNVVLNAFVILNPEHNIPGLLISPTIVGAVGQVGLVGCGCHWLSVVD